MPASAEEGREIMLSWIWSRKPRSVLDIGAGCGTYGKLLREKMPTPYLIGVEIWRPYIAQFHLNDIYDQVINKDIRDMSLFEWPRADVVILGDVLEHMSIEDAKRVWMLALGTARKAVYLSIPIVHSPQGAVHGNPHETHVVPDWNSESVLESFPGIGWYWHGSIVGRYEATVSPLPEVPA